MGYLMARGVHDPEAVTHDVFMAVLPQLDSIDGGDVGARSLIFSIAHARSVDHHRQRSRTPVSIEYDAESDERITSSAEETALESAHHSPILAKLDSLSGDHKEVLLLRIVADLPLEAVAEIMQKSVGSVKQLQRRALLSLKKQLTPREGHNS
jgi:RNA polymerase sigma-70 factor (ECF subfamily)